MTLNILRGLFVLLMAAVGYTFVIADPSGDWPAVLRDHKWLGMAVAMALGVGMICIDILAGRRKLAVYGGVALGIVVGLVITYGLSFAVTLTVDNLLLPNSVGQSPNTAIISFVNLLIGTASCYLAVSFVLQTRDDFRFIIPYVEFRRDAKGGRPVVVDTSALIDGRIASVAAAGLFDSQLIVPQFVVLELQDVADSADRLKRTRGRRGLDVLAKLKRDPKLDVRIYDAAARDDKDSPVDQRLINLALELDGRALTVDYNLNKVAQLSGVPVLNLNELANALKPEVLPGESMLIEIVRAGSGEDQGIGYLDDGTMVVVERGRDRIDEEVEIVVTNTTQTSAGRMIFARASDAASDTKAHAAGASRSNNGDTSHPTHARRSGRRAAEPQRSHQPAHPTPPPHPPATVPADGL